MMPGNLDLVVGGQFGDEGKGASAVMLASSDHYDFTCRVGGSQAEHRFLYKGVRYRFRVLPCASILGLRVYIGAGAVIRPDILKWELDTYRIHADKIIIDPNAAVIGEEEMIQSLEANSHGRGGYSMGISDTLIAKMRRDRSVILAGDVQWSDGIRLAHVPTMLGREWDYEQIGLVEGMQGVFLSLDHGWPPYTTSYNVTVPAILSMLGARWDCVRDVYGVYRTYPMRVAGDSGPSLAEETSWEAEGLDPQHQRDEDESSLGTERLFKWNDDEFKISLLLNAPSKMILTMTDWLGRREKVNCYDLANHRADHMETFALKVLGQHTPVSHIRYGPDVASFYRRFR